MSVVETGDQTVDFLLRFIRVEGACNEGHTTTSWRDND
jgi:hypothetical protein